MVVAAFICTMAALFLAGAVTGVFFAFTTSVIPGLGAVPARQAVTSIQSVNRAILNPRFLLAFTGTPIATGLAGVLFLLAGDPASGWTLLIGAAVYVLGVIAPTGGVNVPLNNRIDAAEPASDEEAAKVWADFAPRWTRWNHLRTASCLVTVLSIGLALYI